jgi:hypothetical protein
MPSASGQYFLSPATALCGAVLLTSGHRKARPPWEFARTRANHYSDLGRIGDIVNIVPNRKGARIMANLYEILDNAHDGEALAALGREFELTPAQTQAAVTALLPAISSGLKQSTATLDGLGKLFSMMGQQQDLHTMYEDPDAAFGREGRDAGNDALSVIFGSPDVSLKLQKALHARAKA